MDVGILPNLKSNIINICNDLLNENKLITTKNVIDILSTSLKQHIGDDLEDHIAKIINMWRLSRVQQSISTESEAEKINDIYSTTKPFPDPKYHKICKKLARYSKQLIKAKRDIKFLRAKIKALNSFYNRQRQEFIMRIEGMLYK